MTAIVDFETFLREVKHGQPLNRVSLGQDTVRAVLRDWDPKTMQLTPQLAKARTLELAQRLSHAPQMAPAPGPGGTNTSVPNLNLQNFAPQPPTESKEG